ncbi:unnamed protein product, partial [Owenia fusiformis]
YKCRGGHSISCNTLPGPEKYICVTDPSGKNLYSMCCVDSACYDNSGNIHRNSEGEWTELDGCTKCTCESNNIRNCDSTACENKCGEYSEFSPCPVNSCGKKIKIRKCEESQRNTELSMDICLPQPPAQCPQPGIALTEAIPIIPGGNEVSPRFNYRWAVAIYYAGSIRCGGTILSPNHILTAAHCFYMMVEPPYKNSKAWIQRSYEVKTGKHQLSSSEPNEQSKSIKDVFIHEEFDINTFNNDIAIAVLDSPIQFNNHTHPIKLPVHNIFNQRIKKKLRKGLCKVIGWGATDSRDIHNSKSDVLLEAAINLEEYCTLTNPNDTAKVTDKMFCATAINPENVPIRLDACQYDSGGPLMCREGKEWYQYGIVSWGPSDKSCGAQAGVYT